LAQAAAVRQGEAPLEVINRFRIIDFGLADFSESYAAAFVDMVGPSGNPAAGQLLRSLTSVPMALEHLKAIPKVGILRGLSSCSQPFPMVAYR
jgi:hypothetical protein